MKKSANLSIKKPQKILRRRCGISHAFLNVILNYVYGYIYNLFLQDPFFIIYIEHTGTNHLLIGFCSIKKIYNERKQ